MPLDDSGSKRCGKDSLSVFRNMKCWDSYFAPQFFEQPEVSVNCHVCLDFWLSGWGRGDSSKIWRHWRTQKPIYVPRMWTHMNCQSLLMIIIGDQWLAMPTNDYQWVSMTWKKLSKNSNELLMNINDINAFQCISMMLMHINVINGFHCILKMHINECKWTLMNFNQYYWISMHISQKSWIPVVPHKAVAEVSKIGNL